MAVRGCLGTVHCATTGGTLAAIADVTEWSFESTAENIDASVMGSCTKSFVGGPVETSGTITCHWNGPTNSSFDAEQALMGAAGTNVKITLFPAGTTVGYRKYVITSALISSARHSASVNGFVESTFNFFVNGAVTGSAVT